MNQDEIHIADLRTYYSANAANAIQVRGGEGRWTTWTYPPNDEHAARRAAWMLTRMGAVTIRHIQRARLLRANGEFTHIIVITTLPELRQIVFQLDGTLLHVPFLKDTALAAIEKHTIEMLALNARKEIKHGQSKNRNLRASSKP